MSHHKEARPTMEEWAAYIRGEFAPEHTDWMESLLLEDEEAFSHYIQAMEMEAHGLPLLTDPDGFVEQVMQQVEIPETTAKPSELKDKGRRWYEHRLFHYAIAACLTLIFLSAGWFDKLTPVQQQVDAHVSKGSYSDELVKVTTGWLDRMKP